MPISRTKASPCSQYFLESIYLESNYVILVTESFQTSRILFFNLVKNFKFFFTSLNILLCRGINDWRYDLWHIVIFKEEFCDTTIQRNKRANNANQNKVLHFIAIQIIEIWFFVLLFNIGYPAPTVHVKSVSKSIEKFNLPSIYKCLSQFYQQHFISLENMLRNAPMKLTCQLRSIERQNK